MENEKLADLVKEMSEQVEQLPEDAEKPLSKEDRNRKWLLQAKIQALKKIQAAREKGTLSGEVRASIDYALLCRYGEKHPLLMNFFKAQMSWWGF